MQKRVSCLVRCLTGSRCDVLIRALVAGGMDSTGRPAAARPSLGARTWSCRRGAHLVKCARRRAAVKGASPEVMRLTTPSIATFQRLADWRKPHDQRPPPRIPPS